MFSNKINNNINVDKYIKIKGKHNDKFNSKIFICDVKSLDICNGRK